jgi:hypothetical protein
MQRQEMNSAETMNQCIVTYYRTQVHWNMQCISAHDSQWLRSGVGVGYMHLLSGIGVVAACGHALYITVDTVTNVSADRT